MKQESPGQQESSEQKAIPNILLRQARAERFWKQADVAERLGISDRMMGGLECGERLPSLSLLGKLCHLYDKPPEQLGYTLNEGHVERVMTPSEPPLASQSDPEQSVSPEDGGEFPPSPEASSVAVFSDRPLSEEKGSIRSFEPCTFARAVHSQMDEDRWWVLRQVRMVWIEGVLRQSLEFGEPIIMDFLEHREALANPWQFEAQETNLPSRPIPCGTSILQIYDETDGDLLILGAPDAGKSTQLFMLAEHLANWAEQGLNDRFPVIFPLCS